MQADGLKQLPAQNCAQVIGAHPIFNLLDQFYYRCEEVDDSQDYIHQLNNEPAFSVVVSQTPDNDIDLIAAIFSATRATYAGSLRFPR
jgi:hypothetical protein